MKMCMYLLIVGILNLVIMSIVQKFLSKKDANIFRVIEKIIIVVYGIFGVVFGVAFVAGIVTASEIVTIIQFAIVTLIFVVHTFVLSKISRKAKLERSAE